MKGFQINKQSVQKLAMSEGVQDALLHAAAVGAQSAELRVPVDTGELMNSIDYGVKDGVAWFGAGAPHVLHVEYGTKNMPAQPFLRPALSDIKKELQ